MSSRIFAQPTAQETVVYQIEHLNVKIDSNPIGGYRGEAGALKIEHIDQKALSEWSINDLNHLAQVTQKILGIYNKAGIQNVLMFAKQENNQFKFCLIPYPKCNWVEKIQGLVHVIFGGSILSQKEEEVTARFFKSQFLQNIPSSDHACVKSKVDVFCNSRIIQKQLIVDLPIEDKTYHLLHDNCPKGSTTQDPHLLVVPKGDLGHCDQIHDLEKQRFHMLVIMQKVARVLLNEGHKTILYLERNGNKLQSVAHKHTHVIGIRHFPQTFFEKIKVILRLLWPALLPIQTLKQRIQHYQNYIKLEK